MSFSIGDAIALSVAVVTTAAYVHKLVDEAKKEVCQEIEKRFIVLESKYKELDLSHRQLFSRYIARGERIKNAFDSIRESHVQHKHFTEALAKALFDISQDLEDVYKKQNLVKRERGLSNYEDFKKGLSVDFDTLGELDTILEEQKE